MEGGEIRVTFLKRERAQGQSEADVVDCVWLGSGGDLGVGYGNFYLWAHSEVLS